MSQPNCKRRRIFIDMPIQGGLLMRVALYWIICVMTQVLTIYVVSVVSSTSAAPNAFAVPDVQLRRVLQLVMFASALVLPVFLLDILRLSHRWVGPIFRLRSSLQALSRGDTVAPITFRKGDYWQEIAGDFNVIAAELNRRRNDEPEKTDPLQADLSP